MIIDQITTDMKKDFSENSISEIKFKNILVVGAGGIGCELLKCLVQTGFKRITIVDLDKIEKSNLNRQFLFDRSCIGKYKAEMAKASIIRYKQDDKELLINSHVGNIKDKSKFDSGFFRHFDIILNALDNIDARTYLNRICINSRIPLVNSGTEGYLGYAATYIRDKTPCFNCTLKTKKKAFPICSIRSKPEKVEHCAAWAKFLFELLFTNNTNGNMLEDYKIQPNQLENFQNYFYFNVLAEKENQKDSEKCLIVAVDISQIIQFEFSDFSSEEIKSQYDEFTRNASKYDDDYEISKNLKMLILILMKSSESLSREFEANKGKRFEQFDKENKDIVNFVYAATCLRSINFSIKPETRFKIKEIVGNIIPAIASTNAIIAGIQTIETIKALKAQIDLLKSVNYNKDKKIASIRCISDEKNLNCQVCSANALKKRSNTVTIELNFTEFTLGELISIIATECKINPLTISVRNNLLYESEEGLDEEEAEFYRSIKLNTMESFNLRTKDELNVSNDKIGICLILIDCNSYIKGNFKVLDYPVENPAEDHEDLIQDREQFEADDTVQVDGAEVRQVEIEEQVDGKFSKENLEENILKNSLIKTKRRAPDSSEFTEENLTNFHSRKKRKLENSEVENILLDDGNSDVINLI